MGRIIRACIRRFERDFPKSVSPTVSRLGQTRLCSPPLLHSERTGTELKQTLTLISLLGKTLVTVDCRHHLIITRRATPPSAQARSISSSTQGRARPAEENEDSVFRRTLYDHAEWLRHRSSGRHGRHMLAIPSSRVVTGLLPPLVSLTLFSVAISAFNSVIVSGLILPDWVPLLRVAPLPFQITAPAIALLLIFRTNTSYSRFDEARKLWASVVNRIRDVVRQAATFMQHPEDNRKVKEMVRYLVAFPYCLKDHITHEDDLRKELSYIVNKQELEAIMSSPHRPNYILQEITRLVHDSHISGTHKAIMDSNVTKFYDYVGGCERIFTTPIPVSFTRLTSRLLVIWHMLLPLALWEECNWITIPATFLSTTVLFCIEQVGVVIEEPFSILPLGLLCEKVQKNVESIIQEHEKLMEKPGCGMNGLHETPNS